MTCFLIVPGGVHVFNLLFFYSRKAFKLRFIINVLHADGQEMNFFGYHVFVAYGTWPTYGGTFVNGTE